ncbi:MAG: ATP-dependent helicase UvrD/PcrA [Actinomycetota bacterium]|nr:ATP-dependent helicase UvrD/PcrA [Actinomycetota bacterium]
MSTPQFSAVELADRLDLNRPTEQQRAVIEAPLSPTLVVAGAGSGKTETMASRVVWLVANGIVRPDQVLGLTFTRKAAGSLNERIVRRIDLLRELAPSVTGSDESSSEFEQASVSTYNSFASAIFRDNALRIGREPESVLLSESSAWQLARRVVVASTDDRLVDLGRSVDQLTEDVLELSAELGENVADPEAVTAYASKFATLAELPYTDGKAKATPYASVVKAVADLAGLAPLVELAQQFAVEKQRRGLLQFSDQVALALAVCESVPSVVADYRERYPVVLLDEYQDTSVVQTRLLARLFSEHGVMAVGDPHQSIYGWRGASAANLSRFGTDFGGGRPIAEFPLSISWRNAQRVLDVANEIVVDLRADAERPLDPRPEVPAGEVSVDFPEDIDTEASSVAKWLAAAFGERDENTTAAILFRQRRHMPLFANALEKAGLRYHVLGIGGLLSTPEIVDLVSALRVLHDPSSGSELIRLLAGARWAIGPKDLQVLSSVAGWLHSHDWKQAALSDEHKQRMRDSVAADDGRSIVDALDFVAEAPEGHAALAGFSEVGLVRLREAATQLAFLRTRTGLDLLDFVRLVEQELLLDIEVAANGTSGLGLANLYAFHDELEGFLASDDHATLGSFLGWLARAERRDDMGPRSENGEKRTVQLLTIHGSKGLEWDLVAVPRLVEQELPAQSREGSGWVRFAKLPFEFRGDASELPVLDWAGATSQQQFDARLGEFKAALASRHQNEERRLGYVAMTRARDALLLTGSYWADGVKPRGPSTFLRELEQAGLVPALPRGTEFEENPLDMGAITEVWPLDPLSGRRIPVERAALAVSAPGAAVGDAGRWAHDLDLLLLERDRAASGILRVALPARVAASRFKDFVMNPTAVATALRRPMPERPYRATRLGTRFHSWVESRYGLSAPSDFLDAQPEELDGDETDAEDLSEDLAALTAIFERSPWASLRPVDVEIEIDLPFDGRVLICKLDAVYLRGERYEIVDWKTGKAPKDAKDLEDKQLQLALYRLAYSRWKGIPIEQIDAVFYYVAEDAVIAPAHLYDENELIERWRAALPG